MGTNQRAFGFPLRECVSDSAIDAGGSRSYGVVTIVCIKSAKRDVNEQTVERAHVAGPTRGTSRLSGSDDADTRSSGKPHGTGKGKSAAPKPRGDVGRALRSVYDDTLREEIPLDLKDLLGRLD